MRFILTNVDLNHGSAGTGLLLWLLISCISTTVVAQNPTIVPNAHSVGELVYQNPNSSQANRSILRSSMAQAKLQLLPSNILVLPHLDKAKLMLEGAEKSRKLFRAHLGIHRPVDFGLQNIGLKATTSDGKNVVLAGIQSPGASGLRVHFTGMQLPAGVKLLVYASDDREHAQEYTATGPYKNGDIWTGLLIGDTAVVELDGSSDPGDSFKIPEIAHLYRLPWEKIGPVDMAGACNLDASCYADWSQTGDATSMYIFEDATDLYACSGTLINNANQDFSPLYLTANHCTEAMIFSTVQFFWFYKTKTCNDPSTVQLFDPTNFTFTGVGATVLDTNSLNTSSDFSLMQILSPLPDGVVYAGWNRDPFLSGAAVTGIHYPEVSYRRISFGTSIDATEPIPPITPQNFIGVSWDQGITEPGSSGSPLLNSSHQIVGTLTGGYSTCALPHAEDDFGRFEISAPQMIYQIPGTPNYINLLDNGLPDDPLAPNQSRNQATNIPYILNQWNNLNPLVLKWQHDDWFHIAVPVNGFVNGYLNVPNPNQGDVQIEIFRDSDLAPSISSTSTMQGDQLSFTYTLPQDVFMHDYYIHVFLANGQRLDYNLNHLFLVQPPDPILVTNPIPAGSFPNITVSGTIDPKGYAYNVYLLAAPCTNIDVGACQVSLVDTKSVNGNNVVTLQGVVPNIQPCYSYYYRIRTLEYNTQKELEGGVYSFHTDGPCVTFNLPIFYNIPTLDFGPVLVGLSSTRSITISNTGNQPLIINDIDFWDDRPIFVIQNNCPGTLNIDNSCNVQVTFTPPDKIWFYSESFNIHHNSTFGYSSVTMQGYGTDWNITTARPTREHLVGSGISPGQSEELSFSAGLSGPGTADIQLGCTGAPAGVSCEVSPSILHIVNGQQTVPVTATVHIAPRRSRRLSSNEEGPGNSASAPPPGAYHLKLTARIGNVMKTQDVLVTVLQ